MEAQLPAAQAPAKRLGEQHTLNHPCKNLSRQTPQRTAASASQPRALSPENPVPFPTSRWSIHACPTPSTHLNLSLSQRHQHHNPQPKTHTHFPYPTACCSAMTSVEQTRPAPRLGGVAQRISKQLRFGPMSPWTALRWQAGWALGRRDQSTEGG